MLWKVREGRERRRDRQTRRHREDRRTDRVTGREIQTVRSSKRNSQREIE